MQNVIDTVKSLIQEHLIQEPDTPLHTGEVMNIWTFYLFVDEAKRFCRLSMNHSADKELLHMLEDVIYHLEDPMISKLGEFMQTNGIPIPDTSAQKSPTEPNDIPSGAKMTDVEISNFLSVKLATGLVFCTRGTAESTRNDVGMMFTEFYTQKLVFTTKLKQLMKKRGWLKVPPYYYAPGITYQQQ
jgi:hypothetical protein